jgi:molybdate transport system substrate-binding protein
MKKKTALLMALALSVGMIAGCGSQAAEQTTDDSAAEEQNVTADVAEDTEADAQEAAVDSQQEETVQLEECEILVAAAASLKNAYEDELIPMFEEMYPGVTVSGTYDSSGKLQTQIEEGLEADVFMSAATKQMTALDDEGLIASDTIVDLLENKIVLIVPAGSEDTMSSFEDIVNAEHIAIGDPESVPAGQYAQEALTSLGLWDEVSAKASLGTNVTEVLNQVAEGSAEAGIVYATDAASMADQVSIVAEAPEGSLAAKVIYPVAVVANSAHSEAANAFVEFLKSDAAIAVFESYGFTAN